MSRVLVGCAALVWVGATLLLSDVGWFRRPSLVERLRPYSLGGGSGPARGVLSAGSFRDVIGPLAGTLGGRVSRLMGVPEELSVRLRRIHSPLDATAFRIRQLGWTVAAFGAGALGSIALGLSMGPGLLVIVGSPVLAFLVLEQQVATASTRRQRRLFLELPIVSEQLGMLLSAGFSLGSALTRLEARGNGVCSEDLQLVVGRIRQGLSEVEALREWAALADVDALDRLVSVLALNREAGDLGRLISEEARNVRQEVQRQTVETIERRGQQVWIPVTVATLLPGVMFMAVPFIEAMRLFTGPT